ncbi:DUF4349 domain-containing protein [Streptomyces megasporus]|uniref:DUF4349 domain-containing protein n=1 Tax=Streptomyces megasporus TaxID=44060 RepID=UPI0009963FE4|nr:DUF4349 domain-containing protein [Streptomyces megasporus]
MFTRTTPAGSSGRLRRPRPRPLAAAVLAVAVLVTGCGATGGGSEETASLSDQAVPEPARKGAGSVEEGGGRQEAAAADREPGRTGEDRPDLTTGHIVRTASLTVTAKDVPDALAKARAAVESAGGYVADESTDRDSEGRERSRVRLRVPPREYEDVLDELAGLGKLVERKVSAKDVTDEVVDVESRIETQRASVARVRKLMDQATRLSDVVTLESELSTRQADLEALQARLKSLEERTGMATVTLSLHEPDGEPVREGDDEPSFGDALAAGWDAFTTALRWIVVVIGAVLPFAGAALLVALVWRLVRRRLPGGPRRSSRAVPPVLPVTVPPPVAAGASAPKGAEPGDGGGTGGSAERGD